MVRRLIRDSKFTYATDQFVTLMSDNMPLLEEQRVIKAPTNGASVNSEKPKK
jgi:hypothetical protein